MVSFLNWLNSTAHCTCPSLSRLFSSTLLRSRNQSVRSTACDISAGCHLLLYGIFVRDMVLYPGTILAKYADESISLYPERHLCRLQPRLQQALDFLTAWSATWLNPTSLAFLRIDGLHIPLGKYIVVILNTAITWQAHTPLRRLTNSPMPCRQSFLSPRNKLLLYAPAIRPVLLYVAQVWGYTAATNFLPLQQLQNRVLRQDLTAPSFIAISKSSTS